MKNQDWENLGDINDRYAYRDLNSTNGDDRRILEDIRRVIDETRPPISEVDKERREDFRSDLANKAEAVLIKDKITGNEVALASVYGVSEEASKKHTDESLKNPLGIEGVGKSSFIRRHNMETNHEIRALPMKRGRNYVDRNKLSENDKEAKKILGLSEDAVLAGGFVKDIADWEVYNDAFIESVLEAESIRDDLDAQYKLHKAPHVEFPGKGGLAGVALQDALSEKFYEEKIDAIKTNNEREERIYEERKRGGKPQRETIQALYEHRDVMRKLKTDKVEAYKAVLNPAHLIRDPNSKDPKLVFSDGVDLTNNWVGLEGNETTPLNDVEQKFSIGKVQPEMIKSSPNIKDGDTVTNSIRLINNKTNEEYNLYSIETEGTKPGKTSGWMRIDKVVDGKPVASNQDAMEEIGIKMYQVPMGPGESEFTKEAITPEGLRSIATERQILDNENRFKNKNHAGEFHVDSYLGKTGMSDLWDSNEELQATAVVVNSHFNLQELSASKIDKLEDMGLIPGSDSKGNNYIGTLNAFYITERGKNGNDILFGQNSIEFMDNYEGARPSRSMNEYYTEIPSNGFNRDAVSGERGYTETLKHINLTPIMEAQRSYVMPGGKYEFAGGPAEVFNRKTEQIEDVGEAWTAAYGKPDIVDAILLEVANENKWDKNYAAKPDNMFGLGEKHEILAQYDKSIGLDNDNELEVAYESEQELEMSEPKNTSRRSPARP